jgi:Tol biopolymer transport system component
MGTPNASYDGKFGLVVTMTEDKRMQLWLLRGDGGAPRRLAEGISVHGAFSPDGRWVAVSTIERADDDQIQTQLTLMETEGEETRLLGEGVRPIWVRP